MKTLKLRLPLLLLLSFLLSCRLLGNARTGTPTATDFPLATLQLPKENTPQTTQQAVLAPSEIATTEKSPSPPFGQELTDILTIAYIKNGDIWTWNSESSNVQITNHGRVNELNISPDGQIIAYIKRIGEFQAELWAIKVDGSGEQQLVSVPDLEWIGAGVTDKNTAGIIPYKVEWVPGQRTLAFNTQQVFQGAGLSLLNDLNLVNIDSLEITNFALPGNGGEFYFSPDGEQVAISSPTEISIVSTAGENRSSVLSYDQINTYSEFRYYAEPVWSPDSDFLLTTIPPVDPFAESDLITKIWRVPTDGTPAVQIGSVTAAPIFSSEVLFSPDLQKILFLREIGDPSENLFDLIVANFDGSEEKVYLQAPLIRLMGWNPDSTRFVFKQGTEWESQIGGQNQETEPFTSNPTGIFEIMWIDKNRYLLLREMDQSFDLVLGSVDGDSILIDRLPAPPAEFDFVIPN